MVCLDGDNLESVLIREEDSGDMGPYKGGGGYWNTKQITNLYR